MGGVGKHSKNLFFTGDNLEVLRHLQNNYQSKIDVIYVDPPYNTGSDGFVYPDTFEYSDDQLKDMFGLEDDQVERLKSIQGKSSHSAWLTFMYPRLVLAKRLMSENGCFFMSIDNNELANAKEILDEIFGGAQYITTAPRKTGAGSAATNSNSELRNMNDYILIYAKNKSKLVFNKKIVGKKEFPYTDSNGKYRLGQFQASGSDATRIARPHMWYPIYVTQEKSLTTHQIKNPKKIIYPKKINGLDGRWMWKPEKFELEKEKYIYFDGHDQIKRKIYFDPSVDNNKYQVEKSWLENFTNNNGTKYFNNLMSKKGIFSNPKPVELIQHLIELVAIKDAVVLDFFAGSATTAEAVIRSNLKNNSYKKFIMIQIPEKTYYKNDEKIVPKKGSEAAYNAGFKSIDEISRERIHRAADKIRKENELTLPENFDGSFKHYRVVKPVKRTLAEIDDFDPNNTDLFVDMVGAFSSKRLEIEGDASGEDTILTTWIAKDGYQFDINIQEIKFGDYKAHMVENNRLYLIAEGWKSNQTKELLNQLGTHQLEVQNIVIFGYSFNIAELRELENGLKQLDNKVRLIKRY